MQCKAITNSGKRCQNDAVEDSEYCYISSHGVEEGIESEDDKGLNEKQLRFCQLYVSKEFFANGAQAYIEAYNLTIESQKDYNSARASASRLLTNVNVCDKINDLLDEAGLNDNFVDKELLFLINQHADFKTKLGAIREYNKLKARITKKVDHTSDGEKIDGFKVVIEDE